MTYAVAMIPYMNMAPYRVLGMPDGGQFVSYSPRESIDALLSNRVVAAAVPVGGLPRVADVTRPMGQFGIAAENRSMSVLFFTKQPFHDLQANAKIRLTGQSASSTRLLLLLWGYKHGFSNLPQIVSPDDTAFDGELVIGDTALFRARQMMKSKTAFPHVMDLATLWHEKWRLPFVFARWVIRKDAPVDVQNFLMGWLNRFRDRENELVEKAVIHLADENRFPKNVLCSYLNGLRRSLTREDAAGEAKFLSELSAHPEIETALKPVIPVYVESALKRIGQKEALEMLSRMPLGELMRPAHRERMKRFPEPRVTFVVDTNPNYTNICATGCRFCAFARPPGHPEAYRLSPETVAEKAKSAKKLGADTLLLQGGHHPEMTLEGWLAYIRAVRSTCPDIHIHPFSPAEISFLAKKENLPVKTVLKALYDEGITTIPGGGAEILSESVREKIAPGKATADEWMSVSETAHKIGFKTTATMMYGHVESDEDIITHLFRLRDLQDDTDGFTSFICWSFKPGGSVLSRRIPEPAHPARYVRIMALARLVLDNFSHIQSSWFSENIAAGQLGLLAGADDFGGILLEENVLKKTGHTPSTTIENVKTMIRQAGFLPARRDSHYRLLEICS